jgi:hypothetical protein
MTESPRPAASTGMTGGSATNTSSSPAALSVMGSAHTTLTVKPMRPRCACWYLDLWARRGGPGALSVAHWQALAHHMPPALPNHGWVPTG